MIISHSHGFVYNKPMKTAGSSLEVCLYSHLQDGDVVGDNGPENMALMRALKRRIKVQAKSHVSMSEMVRTYAWPCVKYTHFTVVRNPWDQAVSLFYWRNPRFRDADLAETQTEFRRWVRFGLRELDKFNFTWGQYPLADLVVKYEALKEGMVEVSKVVGLDPPLDTSSFFDKATVRPRHSRNFTELYDDETWDLVGMVRAQDVSLFGYSRAAPQGNAAVLRDFTTVARERRRHLKIDHDKLRKGTAG